MDLSKGFALQWTLAPRPNVMCKQPRSIMCYFQMIRNSSFTAHLAGAEGEAEGESGTTHVPVSCPVCPWYWGCS